MNDGIQKIFSSPLQEEITSSWKHVQYWVDERQIKDIKVWTWEIQKIYSSPQGVILVNE
jgi:hypothetical protein